MLKISQSVNFFSSRKCFVAKCIVICQNIFILMDFCGESNLPGGAVNGEIVRAPEDIFRKLTVANIKQ